MNHRPSTLALPAAVLVTLMITGCGGGTVGADASSSASVNSAPSEATKDFSLSSNDLRNEVPEITPQEAVATAQETHPGDLRSVELSITRAGMVYQVELATVEDEADIIIDASDGAVRDTRIERSDSFDDRDPVISLSDIIDASDAMRSASTIIDGPVESWTLTHDDGRLVYQVDFADTDREINIDAVTGDVVEIDY